jgi:hypothetical protein
VDGREVPETGSSLRLAPDAKGMLVEVSVAQGRGGEGASLGRSSARVANRPPSIESLELVPSGQAHVGQAISATPRAMDPDGDPVELRYEWQVNGRTLPGVASETLDPGRLRRGDRVSVRAFASDGTDESEPFASAEVEVVNGAPRIVSTPGGIGKDGVFRYAVTAEDPDGDRVLRYRLTQGPEGMSIDPYSGALEWAPREDQVGTHRVKIAVDDPHGGTGSQEIEVRVAVEEPAAPATPDAPAAPAAPAE